MVNVGSRSNKILFIIFFVFALIIRGIYFAEFRNNPYFDSVHPAHDSIVMHNGAKDICQGDLLLSKKGNRYPFYTYFVAAIYSLGGQMIYGVWVAQFILGALASALLFLIGTRLFNIKVGAIVSLFYALYGPNLFYEGVMLRAALTEFLAVLSFYFLLRLEKEISYGNLVFSGIALSTMIQCRPNTVLILPLVLLYLYFRILRKEVFKRKMIYFSGFILVLIVIGMPLLLRGMYVEKQFQFYDPGGPSVLLMGNLIDYDGLGWHWGSPRYRELKRSHSHEVSNDYVWVLKRVFKETIDYPLGFIRLYGRKIYYFLNNFEIPSNNNFYLHQRYSCLLRNPLSNFSLVVSLAFLGLVVTFRDYRRNVLLYIFFLGMTGSVLLFYNVSRFRIPVIPFYLLFSAVGIFTLCNFILAKQFIRLFLAVILLVGVLFYLKIPDIQKIRENDYGMMYDLYDRQARKHMDKGLHQEALKVCEEFIERCPESTNARLHNNLGIIYKELRLNDKAIQEFMKVLELESDSVEVYVNLGSAYIEKGLYDKAIKCLGEARRLDPGLAEIYTNLGSAYRRKGEYDRAIEELNQAVALKPGLWQAYNNLALAYRGKELYRESAMACEKVLALQPHNFNVHEFLASVYLKVREWNKAHYHYTEVLKLKPDHSRAKDIKAVIGRLNEIRR